MTASWFSWVFTGPYRLTPQTQTKGQFSATADLGAKLKTGVVNDLTAVDICLAGIELGATLVARSFSGDKKQLQGILKACIAHNGLSIVDVVSPCVTFNDHEGSTKSYSYMKEHEEPIHDIDFIPFFEDITVEMEEGTTQEVEMHDGSTLRLKKLGREYDPRDRMEAVRVIHETQKTGEVLTGILYVDNTRQNFIDMLHVLDEPLATLPDSKTRPRAEALEQIMEELR